MTLVFDTETTGKAHFFLPLSDPAQPHLVQLGALLLDDDWTTRGELNVIIKPDGYTIPDDAASIHGITTEIAERCGVGLNVALPAFFQLASKADTLVAHNIDFDLFVLDVASMDFEDSNDLPEHRFCTMKAMTNVCRIPGRYGFKWPKLQEAYQHCFGSMFDGAHDAMADVRACARVYRWLSESKQQPVSANTATT